MARTLSIFRHLPRLEPDGVTHRRDCECPRCDAGYGPSEGERAAARQRWEVEKARAAAERALARRRARLRVKQAALEIQLEGEAKAVDERIRALRAAQARMDQDERLSLLRRLRQQGVPLPEALAEVERARAATGGRG